MAITTKEARIPSLRVDRAFLSALGKILERDAIELRANTAEAEPPPVYVSYIVESGWRKRGLFASMDTLVASPLPPSPRRFSVHIHPPDRNLVEVHLAMEPRAAVAALSTVKLSSADEARLRKMDGELRQLFRGAARGYHSWLPHFVHRLFAALASVACAWIYLRWVDSRDIVPGLGRDLWWAAIVPVAFIAYQGSFRLLRWLYPKYEFVLDEARPARERIRLPVVLILAALVLGAAADLFL